MMMRPRLICFKMSNRCDLFMLLLSSISACLFVIVKCEPCLPTSPSYIYGSQAILCTNLYQTFPKFEKTISNMKCVDCNIPVLDETTMLIKYRGETFNLSNSHVQKIDVTAFKTFTNSTHKFVFDNNEINYIAPKIFNNFTQLDDIILRNNKLVTLENNIFDGTNVSTLDLSQNSLTNISNIFKGLRVTKLNLSSNGIREIAPNAFENLIFWTGRQWRSGLQQLDLSNNLIEKLIPNTFKFLDINNVIRSIILQQNRLTTIENGTFSQLTYLKFLSLEANQISELYTDSFKGLTSLNTLSLKNNGLTKIPVSMFGDLRSLDLLDLSMNSLTTLSMNTFSGLTQLTKLNMSHNNLRTLDDSHIFPLGRLISLDVSDTKLNDINLHSIFDHHHKLRILVLNDNFWNCKDLVQMYKQMNERMGGFDYPSRHFDVPNLHGIACSRVKLGSYDDLTFDGFLNIISQDNVFEDLYDSRINKESPDVSINDFVRAMNSIRGIYFMFILLTIIVIILFTQFVVRHVFRFLYNRKIVSNDKFSFAYTPNQDNVELI